MMTKKQLQTQIENMIGEPRGSLSGESVKEVLNDMDSMGSGFTVYWGCIPDDILNDVF